MSCVHSLCDVADSVDSCNQIILTLCLCSLLPCGQGCNALSRLLDIHIAICSKFDLCRSAKSGLFSQICVLDSPGLHLGKLVGSLENYPGWCLDG